MKKLIGTLVILFICLVGEIKAEIYYVKETGDDTKTGINPNEEAWQHPSYAATMAKAGDTVYLISGTWNDEHIVLVNSGTENNPIIIAGYGGKAILDGVDKTGIGIRTVGKSYYTISGVHIKNYYEGISIEDTTTGVILKDFIIEKTQRTGLIFKGMGSSVASNISISDFTMNETGWDGYPAISHGYGWDSHDIEIYNFEIHNTYGEAINWRFSKRVHIFNGSIHDTASDAIHLQLSVHDSIIENMWIKNTGWHGIAIHDHTVGTYPCYNNIIRNCYVGYALHNDIDLHSGAYDTIVENCTLDGTPATGQGIYFHNLGAGLIARNNTIYNTGDGIDGGPLDGQYLRDILIEDNTLYNLSTGISFQGATENITIRRNLVYNTDVPVSVGSYNILIEENDIKGKTYRVNTGDGKIRNPKDEVYDIRSSWGADVVLEYTEGNVFGYEVTYNHGANTYTPPQWFPTGSEFKIKSTADPGYNGIIVKITGYPIKVMPESDIATVIVTSFDASVLQGEMLAKFSIESTIGNNINIKTGSLKPRKFYKVKKDNNYYTTAQANADGWIKFSNTQEKTVHRFEIEELPLKEVELDKVTVSPNPYNAGKKGNKKIIFGNLDKESTVKIFSLGGELIKIIRHISISDGDYAEWDVSDVASGVYIYYIESAKKKKKGKVSIIK